MVVLKKQFLITRVKVVSHSVCPLQRSTTSNDFVHCLLHELHLDPGQLRRDLHLLHLLLGLGVELCREFSRLLVVRPAVVILRRYEMRCIVQIDGLVKKRTWR